MGSPQQSEVERDQATSVFPILVQKFDSEIPQASFLQANKILGTGLRASVENRVPATDVRFHQMSQTDPISHFDPVPITWPAAVGVVSSIRQEGRKHTVLHVKHRHMLMQSKFVSIAWRISLQRQDLLKSEVVGDSQAIQALFR